MLALAACFVPSAPAGAAEGSRYAGTIAVEHQDRVGGRASERLVLRARGRSLAVPEVRRLRALAGRSVVLSATRRGDRLMQVRVVRAAPPSARAADHTDDFPSSPPASGERRVAVVLLREAGDPAQPWDPARTDAAMFGPGTSVAAFFAASSSGEDTLAGRVFGWYEADLGAGCDPETIARRGLAALTADGVRLRDFHHVMVHFPRRGCPFNGSAWISDPMSLINGRPDDVRLLSHELGHNFGLYHAKARTCSRDGVLVALSEECSRQEYGDPFSTMGHNHHQFHGVERAAQGWMPADHQVQADRDGVYSLAGQGGTAPEVLVVPRRIGGEWWKAPTHLTVEMRRATAPFDLFAADDPAVSGLSIRLASQVTNQGLHFFVSLPMELLDMTPGSPYGHRDAQLRVGETFVDERSRTAITLEDLRDGVAQVRVGWVPSAPGGVVPRLDGPTAAVVGWGASEDDRGVVAYELERDGAVVARTAALVARDEGLPTGRDVRYRVVAIDGDGNRRASAPVTLAVPAPVPATVVAPSAGPPRDATRPRLALRPLVGRKGLRMPRDRRLTLTASDDRPDLELRVALDGRVLGRGATAQAATSGRLVVRLPARARRGRHLVELTATDAAGNRSMLRLALVRGKLRRLASPAR